MKIVLDTNVLVSGLLTPFGSSGEIVRMVFSNELTPFFWMPGFYPNTEMSFIVQNLASTRTM